MTFAAACINTRKLQNHAVIELLPALTELKSVQKVCHALYPLNGSSSSMLRRCVEMFNAITRLGNA